MFEYVASRGAAWDCPISLHASLDDLRSNPRAVDCLAAIKIWEDARLGNHLSENECRLMCNVAPEDAHYVPCFEQRQIYNASQEARNLTPSQRRILADRREHHLFINEQGRCELVEIEPSPEIAQGTVKAFLFRRPTRPDDTYVIAWAVSGELHLRLPGRSVVAMRPLGTQLPGRDSDRWSDVPVGPRTYLVFNNTDRDTACRLLGQATVVD